MFVMSKDSKEIDENEAKGLTSKASFKGADASVNKGGCVLGSVVEAGCKPLNKSDVIPTVKGEKWSDVPFEELGDEELGISNWQKVISRDTEGLDDPNP